MRNPGFRSVLTAMLFATACAGATQDDRASGGAIGGPTPTLEELVTIGCDECEGPEQLNLWTMTMTPDGRVWAVDRREPVVRVFEPSGEVAMTFGVRGQGPGELELPLMAYALSDGSVLVHDMARFHRFDGAGQYLSSVPMTIGLPFGFAYDARRRSLYTFGHGMEDDNRAVSRVERWNLEFLDQEPQTVVAEEALGWSRSEAEKNTVVALAAHPDGVIVGDSWNYRLALFSDAGEELARFGREGLDRPAKSREEMDEEARLIQRLGSQSMVEREHPHFDASAIATDPRGRVWVMVYRDRTGPLLFDVFSRTGAYLGEVRGTGQVSMSAPFVAAAEGIVAAVVELDDGEQRIRVWRVVEPG